MRKSPMGPKVTKLLEILDGPKVEKCLTDTMRKSAAKLQKLGLNHITMGIAIRTDGKFVPFVILKPQEDAYEQAIRDRGIWPVPGA